MDNYYNQSSKRIPYDDTPIYRKNSAKQNRENKPPKVKLLSVILVALIIMNIILCVTCYTYLKNGKIKIVNIYNDTFSGQNVNYMEDAMRSAKYSSVIVAAGMSGSYQGLLINNKISSNNEFYNNTVSHGAGFLYKINGDDAYFITCYHVIGYDGNNDVNNTRIWVLPATMLVPIEVELVAYHEKEDIAVLKYTHSNILETLEGLKPVSVYDSTFLSEYEDVFTIGNPLNYGFTGTDGKITSYRQILTFSGSEHSWIKINVAINPGNSGGALYNSNGQFIGMVNARIEETNTGGMVSNYAYAIPGTLVKSIADNIIENDINCGSKPRYADVGINFGVDEIMGIERYKDEYIDQNGNEKELNQEYVIVESFTANSIAKASGIKLKDRIVSVELKLLDNSDIIVVPIINKYTFYEYAYAISPGSTIKFNIKRQNEKNETIDVSISLIATKYS